MKKTIIIWGAVLISGLSFSQVGISTVNPIGTFHVDGGKDNPATGAPSVTQQLNDFNVTSTGNVGIGTVNPSQKLEIQTGGSSDSPVAGFKLTDGTQHDKYVLTSDPNGIATWKTISVPAVQGVFSGSGVNIPFTTQQAVWQQTGANVVLGPGKWKVDIILLLQHQGTAIDVNTWMWLKSTFTDSPTSVTPVYSDFTASNVLASQLFSGPAIPTESKNAILQGSIILNNTSGNDKTYYLLIGDRFVGGTQTPGASLKSVGGTWGENSIIAYPMSN